MLLNNWRQPDIEARAHALLRRQLAKGPRRGDLVEAAAQAAEIPKRDLLDATHALGVRAQRGQWSLPSGSEAPG